MTRLLPLLLLAACSEYGLGGEGKEPLATFPHLDVDPGEVDAAGLCAATDVEVTIRNDGDGVLNLSAVSVEGQGWTMEEIPMPLALAAGEATLALLSGTDGEATLIVESDDPETPREEVPLRAQANLAPRVTIASPAEAEILAEGLDVTLLGSVRDDADAADALGLSWDSDVGGNLSTTPAAADGETSVAWAATSRASGPQVLTLTATDSCGAVGSATVNVCQDGAYTYDGLDLSAWHYEGMAYWDEVETYLVLTDTTTATVGTAFETSAPVNADNVEIDFAFYIGGGSGADGFSLTALDATRMTTFLGGTGCGIGYGGDASCTLGPALPGWSIEVDTYYNSEADRSEADHVAFTFDGDVDGYRAYAELPEMEDTGWHQMVVRVLAPRVTVTIDSIVYIDEDIAGNWAFPAYVGFTAGTGGDTNWHIIDALQVTDYACD